MNEENYRRWDIAAKFIAPILTVAGILIGLWQFSKEQASQIERQRIQTAANETLEFKRRMLEKQLVVYSSISNVVGQIAASREKNDKAKLLKKIDEFYALYWGEMIYVKSDVAERAMINFHIEIQDFLKNNSDEDRLKIRASELIEALRQSSKDSWNNTE